MLTVRVLIVTISKISTKPSLPHHDSCRCCRREDKSPWGQSHVPPEGFSSNTNLSGAGNRALLFPLYFQLKSWTVLPLDWEIIIWILLPGCTRLAEVPFLFRTSGISCQAGSTMDVPETKTSLTFSLRTSRMRWACSRNLKRFFAIELSSFDSLISMYAQSIQLGFVWCTLFPLQHSFRKLKPGQTFLKLQAATLPSNL